MVTTQAVDEGMAREDTKHLLKPYNQKVVKTTKYYIGIWIGTVQYSLSQLESLKALTRPSRKLIILYVTTTFPQTQEAFRCISV